MEDTTCGCLTHQGPHWLHMDYTTKKQNFRLLALAVHLTANGSVKESLLYMEAFMHAENRRLDEKLRNMKEHVEYAYDILGNVEDLRTVEMAMMQKMSEDFQCHYEAFLLRHQQEKVEQGVLF